MNYVIYNEFGNIVTPDDMTCHDFISEKNSTVRTHSFNTCCNNMVNLKLFKKLDIISVGYNHINPNGRRFINQTHINQIGT